MCGITGLMYWNGTIIDPAVVQAMTDVLAHRGPDGEGFFVREHLALGHRRLAIIDPDGGSQPLSNEDGKIWITYNGELYNFLELRNMLEKKGHVFRTNSDTEMIVHAYEEWGDRCVERFRGMFAFAIADFRNQRFFLATDHLGIKPLYYLHHPDFFAFASELGAFRALPGVQLTLNPPAIDQYLELRYIPAPETAFKQIRRLPPAHRLLIPFTGESCTVEEYWQLEFAPDTQLTEDDWIEAIDETLKDSIRSHLISDVPFGAFLSGGVDSSGVVAYMAQILDQPVQTFSIGFEDQAFNELPYAKQVADKWHTDHHVEIVRPNALEILPKLVSHYGEPFGDSSAIPTYYVSQVARKYVPMVLSGDGGDEFFLGYNSYPRWLEWLAGREIKHKSSWKRALFPILRKLFPRRYADSLPRQPTPENWFAQHQNFNHALRQKLWRSEYKNELDEKRSFYPSYIQHARRYSPDTMGQYLDIRTSLPDDMLTKVDIASMAHGLEVRTPLVDIRVLELTAKIPPKLNLFRKHNGDWEKKKMLKRTLARYYPGEFLERPKQGFSVPISKWFGPGMEDRKKINRRLTAGNSNLKQLFEPDVVKDILDKSLSGQKHWMLLFLDEWLGQNAISYS